jgi:hypothetical protein
VWSRNAAGADHEIRKYCWHARRRVVRGGTRARR